jgi:hypothetical protein
MFGIFKQTLGLGITGAVFFVTEIIVNITLVLDVKPDP